MTVKLPNTKRAFTLIELLVVIGIMGILAAITVPAFNSIKKGDATLAATRQLSDDVGFARQLAIARHTTVYMVFVPRDFWTNSTYGLYDNQNAFQNISALEQERARTLVDKQEAAYTFITLRSLGDQPGRGTTNYLSSWRTLPEGTCIASSKFLSYRQPFEFPTPDGGVPGTIYSFQTNSFPFPSEQSSQKFCLPYIAFNYLGQLTTAELTPNPSKNDEYIPLARGTVSYARDAAKFPQFSGSPSPMPEIPAGNSTNAYNVIHIDWLTGRARVEHQEISGL